MKFLRHSFLLVAFALLNACASFGVPTPENVSERAAMAISTVKVVQETATTLLLSGRITVADAENVLRQTDAASEAIAVSRAIGMTDPAAADMKLSTTLTVLNALNAYLAKKGKS